MREREVYEVFVVNGERIGAITTRDLLTATQIRTRKASTLAVGLPRLAENSTVGQAARLMANYRIRALPIMSGEKLSGAVTTSTILRAMRDSRLESGRKISSIMTPNPITMSETEKAAKAREIMVRRRIDHLPVLGGGKLAGILTSNHLIYSLIPSERVSKESMVHEYTVRLDHVVRDMMDTAPLTARPEEGIADVLSRIIDQRKTYSLVTLFGEVQGIATHRDYMKLLAEPEQKPEVPVFMVGLPDDPFEAETAKMKFTRIVNQLSRALPNIVEARSVIKTSSTQPGKERRRYEVKVTITTSREAHSFSEVGWELPAVYDKLVDRMKRLMTKKVPIRKPDRKRMRPV
jgi:CBS domain-containing protein